MTIGQPTVSRRSLIRAVPAVGVAYVNTPEITHLGSKSEYAAVLEFARNVISNRRSARAIATRYLAYAPVTEAIALRERLRARLQSRGHTTTIGELQTVAHELVVADFEHGRTISVEGWVLSESEVSICLCAILQS